MNLLDIDRDIYPVFTTDYILNDLEEHVKDKKPFSTVRFGDAAYGIIASFLAPKLLDRGKWKGSRGRKAANSILGQLTIPNPRREEMVNRMVDAAQNANYCDCFDAYFFLNSRKGVGVVGEKWKDLHEAVGITNPNYCSPFLHYFSIVEGEMNLFEIMKGRRIFCISNQVQIANRLQKVSKAKTVKTYRIPRRGRRGRHFRDHYPKVMKFIRRNAKKYDLFLIGAGFLGKIYCAEVKASGGRAFDAGRIFDFWGGRRSIDSRPKRFIKMNPSKMLCERIKKHPSGVW